MGTFMRKFENDAIELVQIAIENSSGRIQKDAKC